MPTLDACTLRVSKLDEKILKSCNKLKAISRHGVGYDNVDLNYIKKNNGILIIAGKGHEEIQTYKNKNYIFNDRLISSNYAKNL